MRSCGFYSFNDNTPNGLNRCSTESWKLPLIVNCAGEISADKPFTTHNQEGRLDYYLMYIISGSLQIIEDEKKTYLKAGNVVVFPPKYKYKYTYSGQERLDYLWLHFTGSNAKEILDELRINIYPLVSKVSNENSIRQRFQGIFDAYSHHDKYRDRELSALLERLLISIARSIDIGAPSKSNISRSISYINSSFGKKINIPDLAEMDHLSTSRYNVVFKKAMGMTPTRYLLIIRMKNACDLLKNTDLNVKQISIMCGYEDPHFFSKAFKSYVGLSPISYRQGT